MASQPDPNAPAPPSFLGAAGPTKVHVYRVRNTPLPTVPQVKYACANCKVNGHTTRNCPRGANMCTRCHAEGHKKDACPQRDLTCLLCRMHGRQFRGHGIETCRYAYAKE